MTSVELAGIESARREIIAGQSLTLFPLAEVDLSVLLVEDEDVSEVTGSEGREGLEVVAERGPCRRRDSFAGYIQSDHGGQRLRFDDLIVEVPQCCPTAMKFQPNLLLPKQSSRH